MNSDNDVNDCFEVAIALQVRRLSIPLRLDEYCQSTHPLREISVEAECPSAHAFLDARATMLANPSRRYFVTNRCPRA